METWCQHGYVASSLDYHDYRWKEEAFAWISSLEFRFRQRYNLPPTDPRFLQATHETLIIDDWAHYLSQVRDVAVRRGLRTDRLTLDVLLKAAQEKDLEQGLDKAVAEADLAAREAENTPLIRMDFTHGPTG